MTFIPNFLHPVSSKDHPRKTVRLIEKCYKVPEETIRNVVHEDTRNNIHMHLHHI